VDASRGLLSSVGRTIDCGSPGRAGKAPKDVEVRLDVQGDSGNWVFRLTARNRGTTDLAYQQGEQEFDFWVEDASGVVWRWAFGREFDHPAWVAVLRAGEEGSAEVAWDGSVCGGGSLPSGRYLVSGSWVAVGPSRAAAFRGDGWRSNSVGVVVP